MPPSQLHLLQLNGSMTPHNVGARGLLYAELREHPRRWLVTGCAGFIGSNLTEHLLQLGQEVVGLDDFSTGSREVLADVQCAVGDAAWRRFRLIEGDITVPETCRAACEGVSFVLHHAALASVPYSIANPVATEHVNVTGTLTVLLAARDTGVRRTVYASSSAVYGDDQTMPKREAIVGRPLSPYAASKRAGELHAAVFEELYGLECVGLRYFNVFGKRQRPDGPYAAVIPRWIQTLLAGQTCDIYGDGQTSRDFCFIDNVVNANLQAALTPLPEHEPHVYNVGAGVRTTLTELFQLIRSILAEREMLSGPRDPRYEPFRAGDIRDSCADIRRIQAEFGYSVTTSLRDGLAATIDWYEAKKGEECGA